MDLIKGKKEKKYKLLIILGGLGMGGAERMVYELVKNLDKEKFHIHVLCYGARLKTSLEVQMEAITNVEYVGITGHMSLLKVIKVMRRISQYKPDIIHAHMGGVTFAIPWSMVHNKPMIVTVHTRPDKAFSKKNELLLRKIIPKHNMKIVAVSEDNKKLTQQYFSIGDGKCTFVNNGIDIDRFKRKKHEYFTFINVARQDKNKNQIAIVRCFNKLLDIYPNSKLILVGNGPCHIDLVKSICEYDITSSVILPGLVANTEDYYAIADCYVQSSHREAMPLSVLEAMATGLPIISTDVGGIKDVVKKENGLLVKDNIEEELYEAMLKIRNMSDNDIAGYSNGSKKIVSAYSAEKMAQNYEIIYIQMLKNYLE